VNDITAKLESMTDDVARGTDTHSVRCWDSWWSIARTFVVGYIQFDKSHVILS